MIYKTSDKDLSKIVSKIKVGKRMTNQQLAAIIVRNVRYRDWDVCDVETQLEIWEPKVSK